MKYLFIFFVCILLSHGYADYHTWTNLAHQANGTSNTREVMRDYLMFYRILWDDISYKNYIVPWGETNKVLVLVMQPPHPHATIVFIHGYLDHVGNFGEFYRFFLKRGYSIVAFDLPGHGLSSGLRTGIEDFSDYAQALESVLRKVPEIPKSFFAMGFSTGCSVWIEYLHTHRRTHRIQKLALAAPLVRVVNWNMAVMGYNLLSGFITELPRTQTRTTSDKTFLDFIYNQDPLQEKKAHLSWFQAARNWHERVIRYPSVGELPVLIVQGRDDSVVDWRYNLPVLEKLFPRLQIRMYPGNHHILMETNRDQVYQDIFSFLEDV
ncbi:alpha/beta hydrolase [Thermospira aquatica]|uniref:Alpha/beta hydrolase n=1 Tax=Thermospira aquatica TaxID=2828656 RepID=A0AAX3BET9_9SPIR|nr:alpha/beta hydrolase [Thermospira aquatica]URA10832.1 alpha/beta hydrolase [Thermospira aquatica]